jgi:hypothetical protein
MVRKTRLRPRAATERREKDPRYVSWLHEGIPCLACLRLGETNKWPIEACHIKIADGPSSMLGKRVADRWCIPLCSWHHRYARDCLDVNQRRWFDRMKVDPRAFCSALYDAYLTKKDGAAVVRRYALTHASE